MDPWCNDSQVVEECSGIAHPTTNNTNFFQDNFKNERYEPLQDSAEYIDSLETKLRKISSGNNKNKDKAQHREQVLANLLRSDSKQVLGILSDSDIALDREIDRNQIISRIIPKQPLTAGETVRLIQSDVLDHNFAKNLEESAKDEEKLKELDN